MFDPHAPWPFGLNAQNWRRRAFWAVVTILLLLLVDAPLAHWCRTLPDWFRGIFAVITRAGKSDWILIPSLLIAGGGWLMAKLFRAPRLRQKMLETAGVGWFVFAGVAGPGIVATLIKRIVGRARPVHLDQLGILHFQPNLSQHDFQSFPSGDTTTIFAFAMVISFLEPRLRPWVLTLAVLVMLARVITGWHFPSDVFAGMILGTVGAYFVRNLFADRQWVFVRRSDQTVVRKPSV